MKDFNFKKKFGQNFISDKNLLSAIVNDAEIDEGDDVLEIGAGAGSLTTALSKVAKKVVSYEIDEDLKDYLLSLGLDNVKFVFGDVMDFTTEKIEEDYSGSYKLVANLPYYITTPILFKFISSHRLKSMTIMVQKEVAQRIVAKAGSKDYGILSVMIAYYGEASYKRTVNRNLFRPQPNVDSAIVTIKCSKNKYEGVDDEKFYKFISSMFAMRRKTINNNLRHAGYDSEKIALLGQDILSNRAENFNLDDLIEIYKKIID